MNNFNENAAQQHAGGNSQSLVPVHSKEIELSSTAQISVVNVTQIATQELVKPRNNILDGFKCLVCGSKTFMHMDTVPCMKKFRSNYEHLDSKTQRSQRQICEAQNVSDMAIAPYLAPSTSTEIVPCTTVQNTRSNLCCYHCDLIFENEKQVLEHGHVVKFKCKYKLNP